MKTLTTPDALRIRTFPELDSLLPFAFGAGLSESPMQIPCQPLAGTAAEYWMAGPIHEAADTVCARFRHGDEFSLVALSIDEHDGDIQTATRLGYERLLSAVRPSAHPYLLRLWNYFPNINHGDGEQERYRRFCAGRAAAVDGMFSDPAPPSTAIGGDALTAKLHIIALSGRRPGLALENPRQTPAAMYPSDYGPVAPGFSRAAIIGLDFGTPRLLVSGTASVVGHSSLHVGDIAGQISETIANIDALLEQASLRGEYRYARNSAEALRIYLRRSSDLKIAKDMIEAAGFTLARCNFLRGDICRRNLDVEIEAVFAPIQ